MDGYLFLWRPTSRYYVSCKRCFETDRPHLTNGSVGVWRIKSNVFGPFRQSCFRVLAGSCQNILNDGFADELFSSLGQPTEGSDNVMMLGQPGLPEPTEEQLQNSISQV